MHFHKLSLLSGRVFEGGFCGFCALCSGAVCLGVEYTHTECYSCPLKMSATETGETLGRTTFRTWPKSPKTPTTTNIYYVSIELCIPLVENYSYMVSVLAVPMSWKWGNTSFKGVGVSFASSSGSVSVTGGAGKLLEATSS